MGKQRDHDPLKPALRYHVLTPYFDRVLRVTMRDQSFKQKLIQQANLEKNRVVSSLVFHHLTKDQKIKTLKEMYRVLRHGGEIHIADFGKAQNGFMRGVFFLAQLAEGFSTTKDNVKGMIPLYMEQVGFHYVQEVDRRATVYGTLSFYKGIK